ncbi:MAG: PQQ-binding-like beta-propeller repeat protein [Fuerstiella sp.]|nr:PQQ-binding-like beta-propeller repeat protein [Fuerstiella sp.]
MKAIFGYRSILCSAVVAGVFSVIVCALLLVDGANRLNKVPQKDPEFVALRERFVEQPNDDELRLEIQSLDLALRKEYFREQRFTEIGSYLLLGGIAVALILGKWAATMRRTLPTPKPKDPGPDSDETLSRTGLWAVAVVILALVGTTWAMNASYRSSLPVSLEELAAIHEGPGKEGENGEDRPDSARGVELPDLPTAEEIQANWTSFRGPNGSGISTHQDIPTEWDGATDQGILWKTPVPNPGVSSPVVWKDRVFLSGATQDVREVYCFETATGSILWTKEIEIDPLTDTAAIKTSSDTGYAAPTMATDGRLVFAMFADGLVAGLDFSGNEVWKRSLGVPQKNNYGHSSSLATYLGSLIIQFDHGANDDELSKVMALDGLTGKTIWETVREMPASWSSPIVIQHGDQAQVITCGDPWVIAYSTEDGKELWRANCLDRAEVGPTPVYFDETVYAGNDMAVFAAIRADGQGDVTDSHVQWTVDNGVPDTCSPLVTSEFVLMMASYGTLSCFDRKEGGDPLWEEDFGADFISSPSLVGKYVYLFSREGTAWVVEPTREECEQIAEAELGEECVTSPAFQDGRIYIRGAEHLFCIGKTTPDEE